LKQHTKKRIVLVVLFLCIVIPIYIFYHWVHWNYKSVNEGYLKLYKELGIRYGGENLSFAGIADYLCEQVKAGMTPQDVGKIMRGYNRKEQYYSSDKINIISRYYFDSVGHYTIFTFTQYKGGKYELQKGDSYIGFPDYTPIREKHSLFEW